MILHNYPAHYTFAMVIDELQYQVFNDAKAKGFHDKPCNQGERVALIHSEASELLEAIRHGNPPSEHVPEISAIAEELADIVIRCADFAEELGINLGEAIIKKMEYNRTRPHKHGGKAF